MPTSSDRAPGRSGPRVSRRDVLLLGAGGLAALPLLGCDPVEEPASTPGDPLRPDAFGAVGDGAADDSRAVQRLLDASARQGVPAVLPAGTYRCTTGLLLSTGVRLHLERGARLVKDWAARPGMASAFLRNADLAVKADRVRISGPGSMGALDHSRTGVILALHGDDVEVRDVTIDTYAGGQAVVYAGDRGRLHRVTIRGSAAVTGTGGIRVVGGADFLGTECHVESGDDCLQFVPIGNPATDPALYNRSIQGGRFVRCTGASSVSRFMVADLEFTGGDPGTTDMDASVVDCSFEDCHGSGSNRGIVVKNTHSAGVIERVSFTDCSVDMSGAADASTQEIRVQTHPASRGAIRDVTFTRTSVTRPVNSVLRVGGPRISGLTFDGCTFPAPSGAAVTIAVLDGTDRPRFSACTFVGAAGKRPLVVGPVEAVTDLAVTDCRFTGIDGAWAIDVVRARAATVAGSSFAEAAGSTTARAIRVSAAAAGVVVSGNDFTGISDAEPVSDSAPDTTVEGNTGL